MREKPAQLVPLDAKDSPSGSKEPLFGLDAQSLSRLLVAAGKPAFRGKQLAEAMYRQRLSEISEISTLPIALRTKLTAEGWQIGRPSIARAFQSVDGTERYLIEFAGSAPKGETVETVWMPEGDGGEAGDEDESEQDLRAPSFRRLSGERVGQHNPQSALNHETGPGPAPPSASPRRSVAPSTASYASPPNSACNSTSPRAKLQARWLRSSRVRPSASAAIA